MLQISVAELAALVGGEPVGDTGLSLSRIGALATADGATVAFLSNPRTLR